MSLEQGDVILVDFNPSVGHEPAKLRPAVVVSGYGFNSRANLVAVVPTTTKDNGYPLHVPCLLYTSHRRRGRGQPSGESACERIHRRAEPGLHGVVRASAPLLGRRPAGFAGVLARRASRAALQSGRLRLRSEALHPRKPRARRLRRDLRAVGHPGGRGADHGSRRRVPVERPGRCLLYTSRCV